MTEPVEIHDYDPAWKAEFECIGLNLRNALGEIACRIDHIGSTSVPGLAAKPIIDVQISVQRLEPLSLYGPQLEGLGHIWRKDSGPSAISAKRLEIGARISMCANSEAGTSSTRCSFGIISACTLKTSATTKNSSGGSRGRVRTRSLVHAPISRRISLENLTSTR